jgi:hypothetical protein
MDYLFILQPSEKSIITDLIIEFKKLPKEELVENYNNAVSLGIVGSRAQAQRLIALNVTFNYSFHSSPIKIIDNMLIRLTNKIELIGNEWQYQK